MQRVILEDLSEWFASSQRQPMILRGARQVGKTWVVRSFAELHQLHCVELNFEKQPDLRSLFESNDPLVILKNLEIHFDFTIELTRTLLFLDEIQAVPDLLAKLRWFAEDLPQLAVIAAGSLLDFALAEHSFSMPVGRVTFAYLEPLSFEEFLLALGKDRLVEFLKTFTWKTQIPSLIHEQLLNFFKEYLMIGGMPAAVSAWVNEQSAAKVSRIHLDLFTAYRDDFSKYAKKIATEHLNDMLLNIPKMLGEKIVYSRINAEVPSAILKQAVFLMSQARVCHKVLCTAGNGVPLGAEVKEKVFKIILLDVGLVSAALGLKLTALDLKDPLINQGGLTEQAVGQLLRAINPIYVEPKLYYWVRQEPGSSAEIDYLIQHHHHVIPVEVKSGSTGSLKSLHLFMALKKFPLALRINADLPSRTHIVEKTYVGEATYELLSLPFYLLGQVHRLIESR